MACPYGIRKGAEGLPPHSAAPATPWQRNPILHSHAGRSEHIAGVKISAGDAQGQAKGRKKRQGQGASCGELAVRCIQCRAVGKEGG